MNKRTLLQYFFIGFFLLCIASQVRSSDVNYNFNEFTVKNGLAHSTVISIAEDKVGSYWVGTQNGLTRILGQEVINYMHISRDSTSILSDKIIFVTKDGLNQTWVSTLQGISRYIEASDSFEPLKYNNKRIIAHSFQVQEDGLLLGATGQIYKYNYEDGKVILLVEADNNSIEYHHIFRYDKNRFLIVNYYKGIYWVDATTGKSSAFADIPPGFECSKTYVDSARHLWVAPYKNGLKCYSLDGKNELLKHYTTANSSLSENAVTDIIEHQGKIWVATDGGGINILDTESDSFSQIRHSDRDDTSIPSDCIKVLYEDDHSNVWAGTVKNGLIGIRKGYMRYFTSTINGNEWNSNNCAVAAICEDRQDKIWLGIEHNGMSVYNPTDNTFRHFTSDARKSMMSIIEYDDKRLLVAVYSDGVYWFDKRSGKLTRFIVATPEKDRRFGESSIGIRLFRSADGNIHLYGNSIYKFNPDNHSFRKIQIDNLEHPNLLDAVASDAQRTIVYDNRCVYEILHDNFSIRSIYTDPEKEIRTVASYQDELYICNGQGLKKYNYITKQEEKVNIPFNVRVSALICDKQGRLWIASNEAILCYWANEKKFITLSEADGFCPASFFPNTTLKSCEGYIYFGGSDGLLQINEKDLLNETPDVPQAFLMSVYQEGKIITGESRDDFQEFSLPWNYASVSLRIAIKERNIFRKKHIRYIIYNDQYNSVIDNASNWLFLPTLTPGEYSVGVSCYSQEGTWTEPKKLLQLTVLPPWWRSWWFSTILAVIILATISASILYVINNKKRKLMETLNLEKNKFAEEKVNFLINMSHELRTPLSLIYAPLKRLIGNQESKPLQEQLSKILIQVKNMSQLINTILDVRKMEMGAKMLQIAQYELNEWVRDIAENFREEMNIKKLSLTYDFSREIGTLNFDKEKCSIVLSNLLMNALKYSIPESAVTIRTTLESSIVRISVINRGIGLEGVDPSKLFTQFYQGKHSIKGSGIGLYYSKLLIEMQKGSIGFFDDLETGTTFYFELPTNLSCGNDKCEKGEYMSGLMTSNVNNVLNSMPDFAFNKYSILLVDDAIDLLDYLRLFFKTYFKKVYTATDGETALDIIRKEHPDIVISDIIMPGMDGFKLCQIIKTDLDISHIPVILLTALQESQSLSIGYKMGADAYVPKPFDTTFLLTIIKNLLYTREAIKSHIQEVNVVEIPHKCTFSNADEEFLIELNDFIKEQMDNQELDLCMISRHMCMSNSTLYTKIKTLTGYSMNDYLNNVRINKAKEYLISTDKKMTEVSELVGFNNSRYFSTVFKKIAGISPTRFKEEQRSN